MIRAIFCTPHRTEHKCQRHQQHTHSSFTSLGNRTGIPREALREMLRPHQTKGFSVWTSSSWTDLFPLHFGWLILYSIKFPLRSKVILWGWGQWNGNYKSSSTHKCQEELSKTWILLPFPQNNFTGVDKVQFIKMHSQGATETLRIIIPSEWESNRKCLRQTFRKR